MVDHVQLDALDAQQLRELAAGLIDRLAAKDHELQLKDRELHFKQTTIEKLTVEMAMLRRWKFAARSERMAGEQASLLEETIEADLEAIEQELERLRPPRTNDEAKGQARRQPLPANLPRREVRHEPADTRCACGCALQRIGEDVSEKLDYTPGVFTVERHVRGKWTCSRCERLIQAPVPAQVIDKGMPTAGLLAQVLVAKYSDHLPLYRQERIFERAGLAIARSTLAQWVGACGVALAPLAAALREAMLGRPALHADETPVAMLKPGTGKTHRAYLWSYAPSAFDPLKAVVYDFAETRAGHNAQRFLGLPEDSGWRGTLICDDYAGYKAIFAQGVTEAGCLAHARRKFFDLWANHKSPVAEQALTHFGSLYDIEREAKSLDAQARRAIRQAKAKPLADALHAWLIAHRQKALDGSAIAKAMDYSLTRWTALTRYLDDGNLPADNNWIENQIRPIALGRANWLFAGSLRAGQRAAAAMSLIQSAKMNGHDPYVYLKDVLARLPTQPASRIDELLPHRWTSDSPN